jgi:predicted transposase/invertase (TIGR01784 family)
MRLGIDPAIDCVFHWLFGTNENKALLLDIVNTILEEYDERKVVELEILNPYNPQEGRFDKLSIVDIKAKNELGEWFIIEMQMAMSDFYPKRLLYYWARMYQGQLKQSQHYDLLHKVTLISISKGDLPLATQECCNLFKLTCRTKAFGKK